jgi:hyperosmotically inducible protein
MQNDFGARALTFFQTKKGIFMKTKLATAGLLVSALLLPVAGYTADMAKDASTTAQPADSSMDKPAKKMKRRSHQPVSDTVITTKVKALLAKDKQTSALNKTVDGVVTLGGSAKSKQEASRAVSIAKRVKGVKSVTNDIAVS